jgi:nucleoside recognition membrane protein YjiH
MGDAVRNSLNNILAVGGFIVLFSVITRMLTYWGFMDWIANGLMTLLAALDLSYPLAYSLGMGIFEMTLGTQTAATSADTGLLPQMLAVSAILSFSGLSIIAQVMSILAGTPVRLSFYLFSRLVQIIIACILTAVLYHSFFRQSLEAFSLPVYKVLYSFNAWTVSLACMLAAFFLIFFTVMGVLYCKYRA